MSTPAAETPLPGTVLVDGRRLKLTNLDKVLYPETHTTKGEVLAYYAQIAPLLIAQTFDRPTTRKRWPDGVRGTGEGDDPLVFFAKNLEAGTPEWVRRVNVPHRGRSVVYPLVNDLATLTWMAQLAALELHVPQWRFDPQGRPLPADRLVLDLDPGPGVGLAECALVARSARTLLTGLGLVAVPVTSGSKGLHLYARFEEPRSSEDASDLAREIARSLEREHRDLVISVMKKELRTGKVFVDWSQNNGAKTTIAPYSLRGRHRPTVAAPRTWDELDDPALDHLLLDEVLERAARIGDLFEGSRLADPALSTSDSQTPDPDPAPVPAPVKRASMGLTGAGSSRRAVPARSVDASTEPPVPSASLPEEQPSGTPHPNPETELPDRIPPMLATLSNQQSAGRQAGAWAYEMKWDGVRATCCVGGGEARLWSRKGRDDTATYPEVAEALAAFSRRSAVLDGEIVALDPQGRPRFGLLQHRINLTRAADVRAAQRVTPARLMLFDLIRLDGIDLTRRPYEERRELLAALVPAAWAPTVQVPPAFEGDLDAAMETSSLFGLEGVVAKRLGSRYVAGARSDSWLKVKHHWTQEVVVGGWRYGDGRRDGTLGALFLGIPDADGLRYVGKVGTGFSDRQLDEALTLLTPYATDTTPFTAVPREDARDAHWVQPVLVGEVEHEGWSNAERLWHPSWRGWRTDKSSQDVTLEQR